MGESAALLATKLHLPGIRSGFVPRPRLLDRLTAGLAGALTLVCAPAGSGKTALLADWVHSSQQPVAWLSLDSGDNDPARFWRYVAAALDRYQAGLGSRLAALAASTPLSPEAPVATLVNQLADGSHPVVLVLDDYHVIEAAPVHQSIGLLLGRLPPGLRLVIASRSDPPLALARLRGSGQLTEIRAADLRFTVTEAAEVLHAALGTDLPEGAAAALAARTEGWAVGLQLAALSLRGHRDPAGFVAAFSGSHRYVLDYLTEEVLALQPAELVGFLLETSILERLSGPLCAAVTGRADSQALLERVERANLFLVPLDEERRWWRYHQLFADLLQVRLRQQQPQRVPELHRAAAAWWEAHGLAEEAVRHALAAGEAAWVARLMEQHFPELMWVSEDTTVTRWLAELPASVVREPWLCVALASRAAMGGRLEEAEGLLAAAERAQAGRAGAPREPPAGTAVRLADDLPSVIEMLRANFARIHGDAGPATRFAKRARAELAGDDPLTRAAVEWNLAQADLLSGRLEPVERTLTRAVAAYRDADLALQAASVCYDLAPVQYRLGRLGAAVATCRQALELAAAVDPGLPPRRRPMPGSPSSSASGTSWTWPSTMRPGASSCAGSTSSPGRWRWAWPRWPGSTMVRATRTVPSRRCARPSVPCPTPGWSSCSTLPRCRRPGWPSPRGGSRTPPAGSGTAGWNPRTSRATCGSGSTCCWPGCSSPSRHPSGRCGCWSGWVPRPRPSTGPEA
jgi:LuxR family transcriptional regulator, maltose regulon positive regulatory protein